MPQSTPEDLNKFLRSVGLEETAKSVVFPLGFKVVDMDGKKMLRALTRSEHQEFIQKETGQPVDAKNLDDPRCFGAGGSCVSQGCPGICILYHDNNGTAACACR